MCIRDRFFFLAHNITKRKRYIIPRGVLWPQIDEILSDALSVHFTLFDWICCFQFSVIKLLWWKFTDVLVLKKTRSQLSQVDYKRRWRKTWIFLVGYHRGRGCFFFQDFSFPQHLSSLLFSPHLLFPSLPTPTLTVASKCARAVDITAGKEPCERGWYTAISLGHWLPFKGFLAETGSLRESDGCASGMSMDEWFGFAHAYVDGHT